MKTACKRIQTLALAAMLATFSGVAHATIGNVTFFNDVELNHGFLFSEDPVNLEFLNLTFGARMNTWNVELLTPSTVVFSGPTVQPFRGLLKLQFDYQVPPVSFQWAEVLFQNDVVQINASGSAIFDPSQRGRQWSTSNAFSAANTAFVTNYLAPAPVPLPNSVVLMLSAIGFMSFTRRHDDSAART